MTTSSVGKKRIGLIGLGLMGEPMGTNWLNKGFSLAILPHRNMRPVKTLSKLGAQVCGGLEELVTHSDVIVLMLPSSKEVEAVCLGLTTSPQKSRTKALMDLVTPQHIILDMTTSDPASTRRIGFELGKRSLRFADAPVTGGVKGAAAGKLTLFMGGAKDVLDELDEVLSAVSTTKSHFGALGLGHVAKAINNLICIGNLAVFAEALPLGKAMGLEPKMLYDTLLAGTARSDMLEIYGPQILKGDFDARFKLEHAYKDLIIVLRMAEFAGTELPLLQGMLSHFANAEKAGLFGQNVSAIIRPIEASLGIEFRENAPHGDPS